jgi:outer membrane protein
MQEVLNQVNSYVKEYAKKHNYDIVYGTTMDGNILYGKEQYDITDDVLEYLNKQYRGE